MKLAKTRITLLTALALQHIASAASAAGIDHTAAPAAKNENDQLSEISVTSQGADNDYAPAISSVGAKAPALLRDIPQTVNVVNRAVMDAQGTASLAEALHNVPGITIGGAEGGQIGNNINLRGFAARTDIYIDGMRDRGQYYRDTYYLESVEVLKGPSSMLFGRGSTGGVINQVSKKPGLKDKNEVTATVGTDGYARATGDFNRKISDTSAFRVEVMGQNTQTTRDVMKNKDVGVAPSLRFGIGTPTEITMSALIERNNDMPDYGVLAVNGKPADVPRNTYYGLTDDRTAQDIRIFNTRIRHKFSPNLTLLNQTQIASYNIDARETSPNNIGTLSGSTFTALPTDRLGNSTALPPSALFVKLASHDRLINDRSADNQTDLIARFDTGGIHHTLISGLEIGHDTYSNQALSRNNLPVVSLLNPAYGSTPANSASTPGNLAQAQATTTGLYANDTLELNKQWKLVGGVRRDRFQASLTNTVSKSNPPLFSAEQTVNFTSVRAGVIYQPTDAQSYYISYGTSFNPSLEQLTVSSGQQNLDPEKNRSYEVGGKWDVMDGRLSLTSAAFEIDKTNARSQISTGVYELDGEVRVTGVELSAIGRITPQWQIMAGYTHLNPTIVQASTLDATQGKTLANTPTNAATLWTTYNLTPQWEIGGGLNHISSRFASNADLVSADGYTRADLTVAYHGPKYDIRLNVLNAADKKYIDSFIPSDGGRAVPGIGRTALLTAAYRF